MKRQVLLAVLLALFPERALGDAQVETAPVESGPVESGPFESGTVESGAVRIEAQLRSVHGAASASDSPLEVRVGEPFEVAIQCLHPADTEPRFAPGLPAIDTAPLELDAGWLLLEATRFVTQSSAGPEWRSHATLRLCALEPGFEAAESGRVRTPERRIPSFAVSIEGAAELGLFDTPELELRVTSELNASDVVPRGLQGLGGLEPLTAYEQPWTRAIGIAALALVVLAAGLIVSLRGTRSAEPTRRAPGPVERLAALRGSLDAGTDGAEPSGEALRALAFDSSSLVRAAVSERFEFGAPGLTDAEWLAAASGSGAGATLCERLARFLGRSARFKYMGERPSAWAADEMLSEAESLVASLAEAPAADIASTDMTANERASAEAPV